MRTREALQLALVITLVVHKVGVAHASKKIFSFFPLPSLSTGQGEPGNGSASPQALGCLDNGYTDCCVRGGSETCEIVDPLGGASCFCDQSCHTVAQCCLDILDINCFEGERESACDQYRLRCARKAKIPFLDTYIHVK